jgi:hypothetical protein
MSLEKGLEIVNEIVDMASTATVKEKLEIVEALRNITKNKTPKTEIKDYQKEILNDEFVPENIKNSLKEVWEEPDTEKRKIKFLEMVKKYK